MPREKVFRFKQFSVLNHKSAMKVGTDGVLLGAWADVNEAQSVLDVGTGTGLIALMLAQRCMAEIVGIEIEPNAAEEAQINFYESPWNDRLRVEMIDFVEYADTCTSQFDVIVSNPPYFVNSLECDDEKRQKARHTSSLSYENLISGAVSLLNDNGHLCLITPSDVENLIENIVTKNKCYIINKVYVCPIVGGEAKRILWKISKTEEKCETSRLEIEKARHEYTDDYISLTKDYYLKM